MEKLDRLGWVAGFSFDVDGLRIGIRTNQVEMLEVLKSHLPIGWKPAHSSTVDRLFSFKVGGTGKRSGFRQFHLVYDNFAQLTRTHHFDDALEIFETSIQVYVAQYAHRRVFVRAGVVGWQDKAIIIPGLSYVGKSTLVNELVKAGATYYSDEYAVLDAKGRVHPYALPLKLRDRLNNRLFKHPVEDFGGKVGTKFLPAGLVLITHYKEKARWNPKPISAGQGLLALLASTLSVELNPKRTLSTLERVASLAVTYKSARGEASKIAKLVLSYPWPNL